MLIFRGVLVGGFNPFEKYSSKWESSKIFAVKIKHIKSVVSFKNANYLLLFCRNFEKFYHVCFPKKNTQQHNPNRRNKPPFFPVFGCYHLLNQPCPATFDVWKTQGASQTVHKESVALEKLPKKLPKFSPKKKSVKTWGISPQWFVIL